MTGPSGLTVAKTFEQAGNVVARVRATDVNGGVSPWFNVSINVIGHELIGTNLAWYGTSGDDEVQFVNVSAGVIQIQETLLNGVFASNTINVFPVAGTLIVNARTGSDHINAATLTNSVEIDAGKGDDVVWGGLNADLILGRLGNDTLYGGPGDDEIVDEGGHNVVFGDMFVDGGEGPSNDQLGSDTIVTASGNDVIYGDSDGGEGQPDLISTGGGDDTIYADGAEGDYSSTTDAINVGDTILAGCGNDAVYADGTGGPDTLVGGNDAVDAGDGDDYVDAGGGNDSVIGGDGNDILLGGDGAEGRNDTLFGGDGRDILVGDLGSALSDELGGGTDSLAGGAGDDILISGAFLPGDQTAILAIRSEWISARTFSERVANLRGDNPGEPRNNADYFLRVGESVFDDRKTGSTEPALVDAVLGDEGDDLLFVNSIDETPIDATIVVDLSNALLL